MKRDYTALFWGLAIIGLGIVFIGNALNIWDINLFFSGWWTLFLIVPGLLSILRNGFNWGSGILVIIGLVLLLDAQNILESDILWRLIFPIILIIVGLKILFSFFRRDKSYTGSCSIYEDESEVNNKFSSDNTKEERKRSYTRCDSAQFPVYTTVLGGGEVKNNSDNLSGMRVEAILGGFDIDLTEAKITHDIIIEITAVLGGVDIYLPSNVNVVVISGTPILGGFSFRGNTALPDAPKVKVKYITVLGGAEIK